jgi:IstB-like ATP binding protein
VPLRDQSRDRHHRAGFRTHCTTAVDLGAHLRADHLEGAWVIEDADVHGTVPLGIDELGYLPMDATSAPGIFQVMSRRYERGSIVLASSPTLATGPSVADQGVTGAIVDRLLHHATVVNIKGPEPSYARPRPVRQGGRCYDRLTSIASALFVAISLPFPCAPRASRVVGFRDQHRSTDP